MVEYTIENKKDFFQKANFRKTAPDVTQVFRSEPIQGDVFWFCFEHSFTRKTVGFPERDLQHRGVLEWALIRATVHKPC